jgi:two-component system sensor histidine kinase PilS (NtrC family)
MTLRPRLLSLIAVRVVASTLLLGWAVLIQLSRPGSFPIDPFFFLIGLTYGLSVVYLATLRFAEDHGWLVDLQFAADAIVVSAFIHLTGGVTSYFSSLYLLPIIAASSIRFGRTAIQVATLSAVLYLALVTAQYVPHDYIPAPLVGVTPTADLPSLGFAQYTVFINLFGFLAVAWLSRSLAESLRSAGAKLEDASHQIEDLRAFNEYVIDSLLSGLVSADAECRIRTFNRAAAAITGIRAADAIGVDAGELLQVPVHLRPSLVTLTESQSLRVDLIYKLEGRFIDLGLTVTTIAFPDGRPGYLFVFQDVTTMKRLEREARLRQRLAAVGEMAAGIAHEIRNPLASMSGSIQLLREELPLSEEQAQLMDIVLRESERLNHTIGSFLAYARPQRAAASRLDMRTVVEDAAALLRNSAEVRDTHRVYVDVPDQPVWYEADETQVRQIVWNLATNGLRAMKDGGRLHLSIRERRDAGGPSDVVLAVQDEGCGIPADEIDAVFQPFRSTFERGTGLGLATVHRIVTDYNGTIQVSSAVGVGTTMQVRLPAQHEVADALVVRPVAARSAIA